MTVGGHDKEGEITRHWGEAREQFVYTEHSLWTKLGKAAFRGERERNTSTR